MKYYCCAVALDENQKLMADRSRPPHGIQYVGAISKTVFSGKLFFKGVWVISGSFLDSDNVSHYYSMGGEWNMEKIN